jgi:hypothetical protein
VIRRHSCSGRQFFTSSFHAVRKSGVQSGFELQEEASNDIYSMKIHASNFCKAYYLLT